MKNILKTLLLTYVIGLSGCSIGNVNYKPDVYTGNSSKIDSKFRESNSEKRSESIIKTDFENLNLYSKSDSTSLSDTVDDDFNNKYSGVIKRKNDALKRMDNHLSNFDNSNIDSSFKNKDVINDDVCNLPDSLDSLILNEGESVFMTDFKCDRGKVVVYDPNFELYNSLISDVRVSGNPKKYDLFGGYLLDFEDDSTILNKYGVKSIYFFDNSQKLIENDNTFDTFINACDVFYDNSRTSSNYKDLKNENSPIYYVNFEYTCNQESDILDLYGVLNSLKKSNLRDVFEYSVLRLCKSKK